MPLWLKVLTVDEESGLEKTAIKLRSRLVKFIALILCIYVIYILFVIAMCCFFLLYLFTRPSCLE